MTTKKKVADIAKEQEVPNKTPAPTPGEPQKLRLYGLTKEQVEALLGHLSGQPFGQVEPLVTVLRQAQGIDVTVIQGPAPK